jgi:hypothetical protein
MRGEVARQQLVPPMLARAGRRIAVQSPRWIAGGWVDQPHRPVLPCNLDGKLQVAVIADYDGAVDVALQNVDEQVSGDVNI